MKVVNIHTRTITQPIENITPLFNTLASANDQMLATHLWPRMKLDKGLAVGSKGGHGPIRYTVSEYVEGHAIQFQFTKPLGFHGFHRFEINALNDCTAVIKHTIEMKTNTIATFQWLIAIRWLHDSFIEDAFDKVENHFTTSPKKTEWSFWVRVLRRLLS